MADKTDKALTQEPRTELNIPGQEELQENLEQEIAIEQSKKGQKGGKKKVKNTSEELVEIVPSTINKIWSAEYPTTKRPNAKLLWFWMEIK